MKILTISYEFPPLGGGGSKVVQGLTEELVNTGHQVDLVTMWRWGLKKREISNGINIFRIPCIRTRQSMCFSMEMAPYVIMSIPIILKMLHGNKYDVNHTHFIFPDGLIAFIIKKITGFPYFITAHGSDVPGYNPNRFIRQHQLLLPLWEKIVANAEKIICPSKSIQSLILKHAKPNKTKLIPNGINLNKFQPHHEKQDRILVVTRMFERKGVQYFLNALEQLNHSHEIHLVGDGPYLKTLKGIVDEKHLDVHFWGFLDNQSKEIRKLYETSRIFILPSEAENFPIVLLEAMAAGMAIITTKNTGCAEVVGDAALLVNPRDSISIRRALMKVINDTELCTQLGNAARKRLEEKFGWETVARRYLNLFNHSY